MSKYQKQYNEYDEVNLIPLFRFIKRCIDLIINAVVFTTKAASRRSLFVVTFIVLGGIIAVVRWQFASPVYHSSAIYASNLFGNEFSEQFIIQLDRLTSENNYEGLAHELKISVEDAKKIKDISFEPFVSDARDSLVGTPFRVNAYVYDFNLLDSLQYKILDYMENNQYAQKRKSAKAATLHEMSKRIEKELVFLDSVKKNVNQNFAFRRRRPETYESSFEMSYMDPVESYKNSVDVLLEGLSLKEELMLLKNYELIQGFTKFVKPYSPRLIYDSVYYMSLFALFAIIISVYLEIKALNKKRTSSEIIERKEFMSV